jgi:3-isopropylmalate dehydratase small subunit
MENYDPNFRHISKDGDILVGGYNFGSGSSREQAATAILVSASVNALISESKHSYGHRWIFRRYLQTKFNQ